MPREYVIKCNGLLDDWSWNKSTNANFTFLFLKHFGPRHILAREIIREVAGLTGYEARVLEFLRNGLDKKALRLAKRKVRFQLCPPSKLPFSPAAPLPLNIARHNSNPLLSHYLQIGTHQRGKKKREELTRILATQNLAKSKAAAAEKK